MLLLILKESQTDDVVSSRNRILEAETFDRLIELVKKSQKPDHVVETNS